MGAGGGGQSPGVNDSTICPVSVAPQSPCCAVPTAGALPARICWLQRTETHSLTVIEGSSKATCDWGWGLRGDGDPDWPPLMRSVLGGPHRLPSPLCWATARPRSPIAHSARCLLSWIPCCRSCPSSRPLPPPRVTTACLCGSALLWAAEDTFPNSVKSEVGGDEGGAGGGRKVPPLRTGHRPPLLLAPLHSLPPRGLLSL